MKVTAGQFIPLFFKKGDPFTTLSSMFMGKMMVDRFDILNKYSTFDLVTDNNKLHPLPTFKPCDKSLKDIVVDKAVDILKDNTNRKITVLWSGGVDSTGIIASLIKAGIHKDQLIIMHTKDIINEAPFEYKWLTDNKYYLNEFTWNDVDKGRYNIMLKNSLIVFGWCADQLFGHMINLQFPEQFFKDYKDGFFQIMMRKNAYRSPEFVDSAIDILGEYIDKLNLDIKTTAEATWIFNFGVKWSHISREAKCLLPKALRNNCISFYEDTEFQDWSLSNFKEYNSKFYGDPKNYKRPIKEVIYDVFKNDDYLNNKGKKGSMKHIYYKMGGLDKELFDKDTVLNWSYTVPEENIITETLSMPEGAKGTDLIKLMRERSVKFLKNEEDAEEYVNAEIRHL